LVTTNSTNGVTTYTLAGSSYPYGTGETIYYISGSDQFGNQFSDAIKITPVKILDGLSATLTNDNATLSALSNGFVASASFAFTSGSVNVKVGNETIVFDDDNDSVRANNTFAITNLSGTGCTPNGGAGSNPSINGYGITNLTEDSGSLNITINYKDGAGDTTSIVKTATYTKNKKAAPVLAISSTPKDQTVTAKSTGEQIDAFSNVTISVKQTYNGTTTNLTITSLSATSTNIASISTTPSTGLITLNGKTLANGVNSTTIDITAVVTDAEGTSRTLTDTLALSKTKKAVPNVVISATPQAQSVLANTAGGQTGTLSNVTISALEGTTSRFTSMTGTYTGFSTNPTITGNQLNMTGSIMNAAEASATIVATHTDSEGTTGQTQTIIARFTKVNTGTTGDVGANGKRTATGLLYYQLASATAPTTPTATSYTFSTNTFASLTTNWALGAPTFAAGNSNKYWYSTYTAVETNAGGDTAVPTFTTVTQAIGFTGLVTFTSTDKITDGTNTSNIVPSGSITNHIGGANVTTINGGKISTGVITSTGYTLPLGDTDAVGTYTTEGTIFNLDNGSLRSKNFYISSAGAAFFKGTLSAPTGNIGGWQIGSTFISASRTLLKNDGVIELRNSEQSVKVTIDGGTNLPDPQAGSSNISLTLPQQGPGTATITGFAQYISTTNTVTITKTGSYRFRATILSNSQNGIVSNPDTQWMQARLYINSVETQAITGNFLTTIGNYPDFGLNFADVNLNSGDTVYIILRNDFYAFSGASDIKYYIPTTTITGISNVPKVGINQEGFQIIQDSSRYFTIKPSTLDFYNNSVGAQDRKIIGTQSGPLVLNNAVMNEWQNGWQNVYHKESAIPLVHEAAGGHSITSYYWGGKNRAFQIIRAYGIVGTGASNNWYPGYDYTNRPDYFWYNVDTVTRSGPWQYTVTFVEPIYSYDTVRESTEYYSVFIGGRGETPGFGLPWVTNISNTGFTVFFYQLEDKENAQFSFIVVK
jgi:hypothetical protein